MGDPRVVESPCPRCAGELRRAELVQRDDDIYKTLRGKALLAKKQRILDAHHEEGVGVHLAVTVAKGIKDREVGAILRFAVKHSAVKRVSFYPMTPVGRWDPPNPKALAVGGTRD